MEVEIVGFERPRNSRKTLYITGIPSCLSTEEKWGILYGKFSRHGLVYNVSLPLSHRSDNQEPINASREEQIISEEDAPIINGREYGFVTFYTELAAKAALKETQRNPITVKNSLFKVELARPKPCQTTPTSHLFLHQCVELCNHFFGFNGWSLRIVSMETIYEEREVERGGRGGWYGISCRVVLSIREDEKKKESYGHGEWRGGSGGNEELKIRGMARKIAYSRACEDAFSKIYIILLTGRSPVAMVVQSHEDEEYISFCPPVNVLPCQPPDEDSMNQFPW